MVADIVVPRINSNDDACLLRERLVEDGRTVREGEPIAVLETSKATCDLPSPADGLIEWTAAAGQDCPFGSIIGRLYASDAERQAQRPAAGGQSPTPAPSIVTRAARELMLRAGLDESAVAALGLRVVRAEDIERLVSARGGPPADSRSRRRSDRIAATVTRSHQTIPKAFLLVKVDCEEALRRMAEATAAEQRSIGLPELLVLLLGRLGPQFAPFLGEPGGRADGSVDVGVTLDAGGGLFVPVLRDAGRRSLREIADTLLEFRLKALRDEFTEADLAGGHITLSLHTDPDVVFGLPLVLPGQTCVVSLGSTLREPRPVESGGFVVRSVVHLGLAYDHRFAGGNDAMRLAGWLKAQIEQPSFIP